MLTILFPMSGPNFFIEQYKYPKPLIEVKGVTMIERILSMYAPLKVERYIFILTEEDCQKYHFDNILKLILGDAVIIIKITNRTKGAACSALLAIDHIKPNDELFISNAEFVITEYLPPLISRFKKTNYDGGVICFDSLHPKWSYVKIEDNVVIEAAEKNPISRNALSGLFYFRKASDFIEGTKKMLKKQAHVDGSYYIAPVLNEMVLTQKEVTVTYIKPGSYFNFYDAEKVKEYENYLNYNG